MDRHHQDCPFKTAQACCVIGSEELGQEPACRMDGGHQPNESSRICHRGDEKWQDRSKGREADCCPKHATIQHIDRNVVAQVLASKLFDLCEGQHSLILH